MWLVEGSLSLREAYGDWLGALPWDFFLTVTFREPVPMRRQETVTHAVGKSIKAYYERIECLALFAEPHLSRNLHLHGLVKMAPLPSPKLVLDHVRQSMGPWLSDKFGFSKVEVPRGHGAVSKYVAKYCVKADGYYEFF